MKMIIQKLLLTFALGMISCTAMSMDTNATTDTSKYQLVKSGLTLTGKAVQKTFPYNLSLLAVPMVNRNLAWLTQCCITLCKRIQDAKKLEDRIRYAYMIIGLTTTAYSCFKALDKIRQMCGVVNMDDFNKLSTRAQQRIQQIISGAKGIIEAGVGKVCTRLDDLSNNHLAPTDRAVSDEVLAMVRLQNTADQISTEVDRSNRLMGCSSGMAIDPTQAI